jgi:hypothetical protein
MNHAAFRLATGAAMIALAVSACSGSGSSSTAAKAAAASANASAAATQSTASASASAAATKPAAANGLEKMSAAAVSHAAIGLFSLAHSVRVKGTMIGGVPAQKFDLRYEGTSISGSYVDKGSTYEYIMTSDHSYLKTGAAGWEAMGNAPDVATMMAGQWQTAGPGRSGMEWPSRAIFVTELGLRESAQDATVAQATVDGRRVVIVTYQDGSKLYVANTGPAYPVRFVAAGNGGGRRDFSQYGAQFNITAPKNAQ